MKAMISILFLIISFSLMSRPSSLPINNLTSYQTSYQNSYQNSYTENIDLASKQEELHRFLVHHRSKVQSFVSIIFNSDDIGLAKLEVFDILGKLLFSADVYLSENSCDYMMDSNEFYSSASNPGILLVKLSTKENQYLKKFTLLI